MPSLAMYRITPPTDSAEFEKICMDYLAHKYNADASLYGRKGQSQQGVDILVALKDNTYIAAQCKDWKTVSIRNLNDWITKADQECKLPIKKLIILVAVDTDTNLQAYICKVNSERQNDGKIPVQLFFWDDVVHYIKQDQTMLRMYYPEFYQGQEVKFEEAVKTAEEKYPERIKAAGRLLNLFFDEAVKYRVEEFLNSDPITGVDLELVGYSDALIIAIRKLLYRAPMLNADDYYYDIKEFLDSFNQYCIFLPNVTEVVGNKVFATNKYGTLEEKKDLRNNEELRKSALERYEVLKNF